VTDLLRLPDTNHYISGMMSGLDVRYPGVGPRLADVDLTTQDGPTRVSRLMHSDRAGACYSPSTASGARSATAATGSTTSWRRPPSTSTAPKPC